ncbi:hypothetical protein [Roseomonas sp. WA12]
MRHEQGAATQPSALQGLGDRLEAAVLEATAKVEHLKAALAAQSRQTEALEQQAAELERQLAISEARIAVETMHSAGLAAQASHLMAVAVEADLPALSELMEERTVDGGATTRLTEIYDAAFDAKAAELGIEDPARFRDG